MGPMANKEKLPRIIDSDTDLRRSRRPRNGSASRTDETLPRIINSDTDLRHAPRPRNGSVPV